MKKLCKTNFKRVMAYLLALSLIFSLGMANLLTPSALPAAWDGSTAETYAGGSGTQEDPYLVSTAAQLAKLVNDDNTSGKYYKLIDDIVLNDSLTESSKQWYAVALENETDVIKGSVFKGNFDGDGHTVSGIYFKGNATDNTYWYGVGLFPRVDVGAVIKNVGVINSSITLTGGGQAGAIVGIYSPAQSSNSDYLKIEKCFADETVSITAPNAGGIAGALNGETYVYDSYFTGTLSGENKGAIYTTGWSQSVHIYRFYSTAELKKHGNEYYEGDSVYSTTGTTGTVVEAPYTGANAKTKFTAFNFNDVWVLTGETPALKIFYSDRKSNGVWDGTIAENYCGGSGTETDPYLISTAEQLAKLVTDTETVGNHYKLTANIVLNDTLDSSSLVWFNVTGDDAKDIQFKGTLDGDGYVVSGLFFRGFGWGYYGTGIIPKADGATVKNIGLVNSDFAITGGNNANMVGSIIGRGNNVNISGCFADETVSLNSNLGLAGGIIAVMTGASNIENCCFTGELAGTKTDAFFVDGWTDWKNIKFSYTTSPLSTRSDTYYSAVYTTDIASVNVEKNIFEVDPTNLVGAKALAGLPQLDFANTHIWRITDGYPTLLKNYQAQRRAAGLWDGTMASDYDGGDGTPDNPYKIANAEQLRKLVTDTATEGNYYVLTSNIKLNDTAAEGWTTSLLSNNWVTLYDATIQFKGNFNGGGHNISGMLYTESIYTDGHRSGLFPVVGAGAEITNFSVSDSDMSVGCYGGAAAGFIEGMATNAQFPKFSYIDVRNTVTITGSCVGGVVGGGTIANFDNCCVTAELVKRDKLNDSVFGIAGDLWGVGDGKFYDITNCYTSKYIPYNTKHLLVNQTNYKNVYAADHASVNVIPSEVNADALSKLPNLNWKDVWAWDGERTVPYLKLNESGNYRVYALGDTDCDGTPANAADLVVMKKYLLGAKNDDGTAVFAYNADVTGNGTVDIIDLVRLKKSMPVA